jgi:hypothetical protein
MTMCVACRVERADRVESDDAGACGTCRRLYPPTLIRATHVPGQYMLAMADGSDPHQFSGARINGGWATIRVLEGADVDIQCKHIAWVVDEKQIRVQEDDEPVREGKHKDDCPSDEAEEDPWLMVSLDGKPDHERCRYCKAERDIDPEIRRKAEMAKVMPKRKGNIR